MEQRRRLPLAGFVGILVASLFFSARSCRADNTKFEMYSWQNDVKQWCFSLLPFSKLPVAAVAIKGNKDQICGRHDVKRLMGSVLPESSEIYWKTDEADGFVLPPRDIVNDLGRFSEAADYKLILPKGNKSDPWH